MKNRALLLSFLAVFGLLIAGCSTDPSISRDTPLGSRSDIAAEDEFVREDMAAFIFEGVEYTFPMSYDVITDAGWDITDFSYDLLRTEDVETYFLQLANEHYPGVLMEIYIPHSGDPCNSVEALVQELETNGIWGITIGPENNVGDVTDYPELSFKGVTFGSSSDDIVSAFGTDFAPTYEENSLYVYSETEGEVNRCLYFKVENDAVYTIYASYA